MEEFSWRNFVTLKTGSRLERNMFASIVIILVCQIIFIVNWGISWRAGGYLTTAGAIVSFFVHFFGFYSIWNRSSFSQLLYFLMLLCLCLLYLAISVLTILSITLNNELFEDSSDDFDPVLPFKLDGVAGDESTAAFFFFLIVVINLLVMILTFVLLVLVFKIRSMALEEKRSDIINLTNSPVARRVLSTNSVKLQRESQPDHNIPGGRPTGKRTISMLKDVGSSTTEQLENRSLSTANQREEEEAPKMDDDPY